MFLLGLEAEVDTEECRASGGQQCLMSVLLKPAPAA
jgi:hypothetical protein